MIYKNFSCLYVNLKNLNYVKKNQIYWTWWWKNVDPARRVDFTWHRRTSFLLQAFRVFCGVTNRGGLMKHTGHRESLVINSVHPCATFESLSEQTWESLTRGGHSRDWYRIRAEMINFFKRSSEKLNCGMKTQHARKSSRSRNSKKKILIFRSQKHQRFLYQTKIDVQ